VADRFDAVALRERELVELGDTGDDHLDRLLERRARLRLLGRRILVGGSEREDACERGARVAELGERRQQLHRLLEAGDPRREHRADRIGGGALLLVDVVLRRLE